MIRLKGMILNLVMILLLVGIEAKRSDRAQIEAAALERMAEFADVRVKMNSLFDSFDDVITAQAVRVSEGLVVRDDNFNEKFVELIEEAEDLDDRIGQMVRGLDDDDGDDDDMDDDIGSLSRMQVSAAFMEKRASSLMDDVIKTTESSEEDASLRENMATVSEYTKDVLWALKSVETKRKVKGWRMESSERTERQDKKNNRYSIRESLDKYNEAAEDDSIDSDINDDEYDYNIQRDDATTNNDNRFRSSSYLRKEHLTGTPVAGQIRRSSYHRSSSRTQSSSKQNETSSSTSPERDSKTATSRHYQNLNDRYGYKQQVGGSRDPRRRRPQPGRVANIRESTSDRNGHYFDMSTLGNYLRTCSDCAGLTERAQCPMYSEMEELKKWSEELQDLLSYGCAKPAHCKAKGICCVNRKATFRETVVKMTQMIREVHDMLDRECQEECTRDSCQRDPEWMDWSNWSGCSVSCGQGTRQRRRSCNDTMSNGRTCSGDAVGYSQCRMPSCCVDGLWSSWNSWSSCSATCGRGVQQRDRRCDGPAPNQCGRPCEGSNLDRRACESDKSCCIQGNWSGWSSWATCSVTCGQGLTSRRRQCDNPAPNHCGQTCSGTADQRRRCGNEKDCCVAGNWGSWTGWTSCSVSCGLGSKSRMRRCDNPAPNFCGQRCAGSGRDTQTCSAGACCVNGNWGQWASWEGCSATCGRGNEVRRRRCDNPPANSCGNPCPGKPSDVRICGGAACCVNGNWSPWGGWSRCSVSCGVGSQIRERQCSNPAANSCGRPCAGSGKQAKTCRQAACPPKCVNGNWAPWSGWSSCSASCGVGVRTKSRQCSNPPPNFCGTKCPGRTELTDRCQSQECCVNGNWSPWTGWSACSASCGVGVRTKSRQCNNPAPNSCGNTCGGRGELTERCENRKCCVNGNWSPWTGWSACSASCGVGVRTKSRQCNNPAPNSCGNTCAGRGELSDRCENRKCCVNGNWSPWTGWSACSATCGVGVRTKSRQCNNPAPNSCGNTCGGRGELSERCENRKCCVDGNWSQWTRWSSCSATCGYGVRTKSRQCDSPAPNHCGNTCPGRAELTDRCQNKQCCVNGNWSPWSRWSSCSVSCGGGVRSKIRECNSPAPNYCGSKCAGDSEFRENCNTRECCVDGNWGLWQGWTGCSVTCGIGLRSRGRRCDSPTPSQCGRPCPGSTVETGGCDTRVPCCSDGNWGGWQGWSQCSVTCGIGQRSRGRSCSNPPPNHCGRPCPGDPMDRVNCDSGRPCVTCVSGNWGAWQGWTQCSVSCGIGRRSRGRQCNNPAPNTCGLPCAGNAMEAGMCDTQRSCCVNGNWGSWQAWSQCSASCGIGQRARNRLCNNPTPNSCGAPCVGNPSEGGQCDTQRPCCVDGQWGGWQEWAPCSTTCGDGQRSRGRACTNPPPNSCGRSCTGNAIQQAVCQNPKCQVDGKWGPWQKWTQCSVTCGVGHRSRSRACDNPPPTTGGRICAGDATQRGSCDTQLPCCVDGNWSGWQGWTQCSVTCGIGQKSRGRTCNNPPANHCGKKCPGDSIDRNSCNTGIQCISCVNGNWNSWSTWSQCSVSCGMGLKNRFRSCDDPAANFCGKPCAGTPGQSLQCNAGPCCVDGNWSMWGQWTACSVTCGSGFKERERRCDNPVANQCGKQCAGSNVDRTWCNQAVCVTTTTTPPPPRCGELVRWSNWSPWSVCSATCDTGVMRRVRECLNLMPQSCQTNCPGQKSEEQTCLSGVSCCVNGNWSPWSPWSGCSVSCGQGNRKRSRACNNPVPNYCGKPCAGDNSATELCNMPACPGGVLPSQPHTGMKGLAGQRDCNKVQWSEWSPWSTCGVTCGPGTKERIRDCENPYPQACQGRTCPGNDKDIVPCVAPRSCCENVRWSKWGKWSPCSATCGTGVRERARLCNNPDPINCPNGKYCRGNKKQIRNCKSKKNCCVDGKWGNWNNWSACSATCGRGSKERRRLCDSPPANYCGRQCVGREYDTETCEANIICPIVCDERNWSQWSAWTPCTTTCGSSVVQRSRQCDPPTPNSCKDACRGDNTDSKLVSCGPEPIDGNWSAWNDEDCRGVCTQGVKYMRRYCTDPAPNYCGKPCAGRATEECDPGLCTQECAMRQWTVWGQWSSCTRTCGQGAIRIREMQCEFLGGLQGRKDCGQESYKGCRNERKEQLPCLGLPMCNGDTTWGEWSACSATCRGNGVQTRRMMVMTFGGLAEVRGGKEETKLCSVDSPECHGPWGPWGPCSATCRGQGIRQRRTLVDLTDLGTIKANASQTQTEDCNVNAPECPTWGPWGPCTGTCRGEGVRQRRTIIRANLTDGGSIEASASQTQTDTCWYSQGPACPEWTSWSACSATCKGPGVRERILQDYGLPESQRPRKTETCFGTGPECPTTDPTGIKWGEWGPCSATCRGSGVRVRASLTRTYLSEGVWVEAKAVQKQTQACSGSGPECPSAPSWSTWESWCPCGCNNGQRSRRRECVQTSGATGQATKVDISHCSGEGRQEERCETRGICPECIVSCDGRPDGKYPTCSGCRDHMTCSNGQLYNGVIEQCQGTEVWDAFINKCVSPPSPSCSLKDCVSDCTNIEDGNYHHCSGCGWYVQCFNGVKRDVPCGGSLEFNQFAGKCTFERSPTCKRSVTGFGVINTNAHGQRGSGTSGRLARIQIRSKGRDLYNRHRGNHSVRPRGYYSATSIGNHSVRHRGYHSADDLNTSTGGTQVINYSYGNCDPNKKAPDAENTEETGIGLIIGDPWANDAHAIKVDGHGGSVTHGGSVHQGGSVTHGGSVHQGGSVTHGGSVHQGGSVTHGGSVSHGSNVNRGGSFVFGGGVHQGGRVNPGGSVSQGGIITQGGFISQGGRVTHGGSVSQGGRVSQGGSVSQGGRVSQGGNVINTGSGYSGNDGNSGFSSGSHRFQGGSTHLVHRQGGNVGGTGSQTQGSRTSGWSGGSQPSSHSFKPSSSSSSSSTFLVHTGTRGGSRQSGSGQSVVSPTHKASRISLRNGRRQILGCVSSCSGSEPGRYASCQVDACNEYVVCTSGNKLRTRQCHGAKEWDDVIKKCVRRSSTCR